jgi:TonB family protein
MLVDPASATAESPTPPQPPAAAAAVQAPRLTFDPGASYPEQALRERFFETVTVPLVLEIDASGAVVSVKVESPQGHGFDEAAELAAAKLVFDPGLRDGKPAAARITSSLRQVRGSREESSARQLKRRSGAPR